MSQHCDSVCRGHDLAKLMSYKEDRVSVRLQLIENLEQPFNLMGRKDAGRLVANKQSSIRDDEFNQLHLLALAHCQRSNSCAWVNL